MMNIAHTILNETKRYSQWTAIVERERCITYDVLLRSAKQVAKELRSHGIQKKQRVGLMCSDSIEYIIMSLGVLFADAVIVPIHPSFNPNEVEVVLERIDANFLIFDSTLYLCDRELPFLGKHFSERQFSLLRRTAREDVPQDFYSMNPAFIRFSSGTTGASKGVVISHEAVVERTDAADKGLQITHEDVVAWLPSMSYHYVVSVLLFLRRGATIILCADNLPWSLLDGLSNHRATFIYASPVHYYMMVNIGSFSSDMLSNMRLAVSTASALPADCASAFYEKFGIELCEAYGIIEVGLPFVNSPATPAKRGSVGKILPDYKVKITDANEKGDGTILMSGPGMFEAYFSPWQLRSHVCHDGWFDTGDIGRLDRDGYLYIAGREKNVINFAGMKVFPQEIEEVLNQHPLVEESVVYGIPHPCYGQLPCAKVVMRNRITSGFNQDEMRNFCYHRLASYKVPKEIRCVERLDRTPSGKLIRH